jgi:hypothetical protein
MKKKTGYKNAILFSTILYKMHAIFTDISRVKKNLRIVSSAAPMQLIKLRFAIKLNRLLRIVFSWM